MENVKHERFRLGRKPYKHDTRNFKLSRYLKMDVLPPAPLNGGYTGAEPSWPMMYNDRLGDCVCAYAGHAIQIMTTYAQATPTILTDRQVLQLYETIGGYVPTNPSNPTTNSTDNGCVISDLLKYWRTVGINGHKILAYAQVDWTNHEEVKQAIQLFGSVCVGINMPLSAQRPPIGNNGLPLWHVTDGLTGQGAPASWGGHCVPFAAFGNDSEGNLGMLAVSWGGLYDVSWEFNNAYVEEMWAVISTDWINSNGNAPSGFDLATLQADLAQLK